MQSATTASCSPFSCVHIPDVDGAAPAAGARHDPQVVVMKHLGEWLMPAAQEFAAADAVDLSVLGIDGVRTLIAGLADNTPDSAAGHPLFPLSIRASLDSIERNLPFLGEDERLIVNPVKAAIVTQEDYLQSLPALGAGTSDLDRTVCEGAFSEIARQCDKPLQAIRSKIQANGYQTDAQRQCAINIVKSLESIESNAGYTAQQVRQRYSVFAAFGPPAPALADEAGGVHLHSASQIENRLALLGKPWLKPEVAQAITLEAARHWDADTRTLNLAALQSQLCDDQKIMSPQEFLELLKDPGFLPMCDKDFKGIEQLVLPPIDNPLDLPDVLRGVSLLPGLRAVALGFPDGAQAYDMDLRNLASRAPDRAGRPLQIVIFCPRDKQGHAQVTGVITLPCGVNWEVVPDTEGETPEIIVWQPTPRGRTDKRYNLGSRLPGPAAACCILL